MVLPRNKRRPAKPKATLKVDTPDTKKLDKLFLELARLDEDLCSADTVLKEAKKDSSKTTEKTEIEILTTVSDLGRLCHAHMTKCGVAFKPPVSVDIAAHCVTDLRKMIPALTGEYLYFVSLADGSDAHELMLKELRIKIRDVCGGITTFNKVVQALLKMDDQAAQEMLDSVPVGDEEAEETEESIDADAYSKQLIRVAQTWKYCNALQEFCATPFLDVAKRRLKEACLVMTDAASELKEWMDNEDDDNDDPFGLDTDDEEDLIEDASEPTSRSEEIVALAEAWHTKLQMLFKLVQALATRYSSLCKSDSSSSRDRLVSLITGTNRLAASVDDLVTGFLMNSSIDELQAESKKLDDIVRDFASSDRLGPNGESDAATVFIDGVFTETYGL